MNVDETVVKKEDIIEEDPLSYKPAIEEIDDKNITVQHEPEDEGVKTEVDPLSATMDQDPSGRCCETRRRSTGYKEIICCSIILHSSFIIRFSMLFYFRVKNDRAADRSLNLPLKDFSVSRLLCENSKTKKFSMDDPN